MSTPHASPPSVDDIFRYRYQHGTNVGPIFMHGPWLDNNAFETDLNSTRELEEIKRSIETKGLDETRSDWESHWRTALTDDDLVWLRTVAKCNSIRLPVGFFTFGPVFCMGTPFEGEPSQVYNNCWNTVRHLLRKCYDHGIGVLIDFQTIPGRSQGRDRTGNETTVDACPSSSNWSLARDCVAFIVQEVTFHAMSEVIGVQISSDTDWKTCDLEKWYDEVLEIASSINPSLPMFISDGGDLSAALDLAMSKNQFPTRVGRSPIVVDTHRYYTAGKYRSMDPMSVIQQIPSELAELETRQKNVVAQGTAVDVYVGEYSCAMHPQSWSCAKASEYPSLMRTFGQAQGKQWASKACGSAFCGFKLHGLGGDAWNLEQQVDAGNISAPVWLALPQMRVRKLLQQAETQREHVCGGSLSHESSLLSSSECHHYELGWDTGFSDALTFFGAVSHGIVPGGGEGGDRIGALELWIRKRISRTNSLDKQLGMAWEKGLRRGVDDFCKTVGI